VTATECQCGRPAPSANLCQTCADDLRANLHKIADRWAELEDALTWRDVLPGTIGVVNEGASQAGERKLALSTGTVINERAVRARRAATDAVWFAWRQVIVDDHLTAGKHLGDPPVSPNRSQDETPKLARHIAVWHVGHITHKTSRESAEDIRKQVEKAEQLVYDATHPSGAHWVPVTLKCDMWSTSEMGERIPCPGEMYAYVGGKRDTMPDLVCNVPGEDHTVAPGVWERSGWKRRLREPLDPSGLARLAGRLGR
jgi:hypothetical protein